MGKLLIPLAFNWSGGKDSSFALWTILHSGQFDVKFLQTTLSEEYQRVSMHGVRRELLVDQADSIGIPLKEIFLPEGASMEVYNERMLAAIEELKQDGIKDVAFGDLFLEDLKDYRIKQSEAVGMQAHFPIWGIPTDELAKQFIAEGFRSIVVCTDNSKLDPAFCGRLYDEAFLHDLPSAVDPCGENGEFHTFCFDGPIFRTPVEFTIGECVQRKYESHGKKFGFTFCELEEVIELRIDKNDITSLQYCKRLPG